MLGTLSASSGKIGSRIRFASTIVRDLLRSYVRRAAARIVRLEGGELSGLDNLDWYSLERSRNGGVDLRCLMLDINLDCDLARLVCGSDSGANHPRNFEQVGLVPILDGAGRDHRRTRRTQSRIRGCGRCFSRASW